jgi:hypothetical protein
VPEWFIAVATALVLVGAAGRLTRLIVDDTWPPTEWLKFQYLNRVNEAWAGLVTCAFCLAPWFTLALGLWGYLTGWQTAWWLFCGWLAASYAASMLVVRDTPE